MVQSFFGTVLQNKMMKSVVVQVTRIARHAKYGKTIRNRKKYVAHDETDQCNVGDMVKIISSRPISKTKRWIVEEVIRRQPQFESGSKATAKAAFEGVKLQTALPTASPTSGSSFSTFAASALK
mmetsp:Transcript_38652/g.74107  ORF Transcript_38652/g.74107 Transcript_38652/m.74107 type:complete len:124 (+) Transcript_38652:115-486(+)|eukprot:CAMPEP_0114255482 /NCGR_PEP_ID=MMETSP0058-20121206/17585_1 /TAXON_ID=36894 /ORGANISM="Pyramimonas parkeae, CCMP726" /LENGTH=123 /DNA_ID=CAMNT_0001369869 /DNA_START=106 /DNA_END=477 /DNA_ORIENTATION=+